MALEVAPILVPRGDDTAGQQHPALGVSPTPLSPVLSPKVAKPTDPAELAAAIRKQVEFYFSDANLPTDKHLLKQISKDPEGYVPLKMIANFKRVKGLTKELSVVTDALKGSSLLSVDEEGSRVRRTTPLPTYDTTDICRRTVVAEHLPDKPTIESVTQLFAQYGEVAMVRICSRGSTGKLPAWLNKAVEAINMGMGQCEFALVEFSTEEECVHCVTKTKNPDNWRTSLRVRHLLPNFKLGCKGTGRRGSETGGGLEPSGKGTGRRGSETGGGHEPAGRNRRGSETGGGHEAGGWGRRGSETGGGHESSGRGRRGSETGGAHGHGSHNSSSGGGAAGRRSMDAGPGLFVPSPGAYQPPSRRSLEFGHHQRADLSAAVPGGGGSSGGGADVASPATAATASAAAAAAAAGLPVHLSPIRTQPTSSGGGFFASSSGGGAVAVVSRLPGSPSAGGVSSPGALSPAKAGSPIKAALGGIGGSIGSPRVSKSPAPAAVASLIDNILAAPTGGTPTRDARNSSSSGGRWGSGSGLGIEVDRTGPQPGSKESSPAAAVAAALAGVMTPPQSGSPRASTSSSTAGARESFPGGLRTPTRMSAAGAAAAAAAGSSGGGGHSPAASPMAPHLAAQAAAAAACAMTSSPKASNASSWRSSGNTPTSSMPGTPLSNSNNTSCPLSISAGAAVAAALEACSPPAGASGAFTVGSPNLSGAGKAAPWVPASRLAHHQRMAAASQGGSSDGGAAAARSGTPDTEDNWRSGGGGTRPPRGPRGSGVGSSSGGGASSGGTRQRRKSWHATDAEEAAIAAAASSAAAEAAAAADGSNSDTGSSIRKSGRQSSRLGQAGDYHATIEAIREASCELDNGAVGRAIAALSIGGARRTSGSGGGSADGALSPEGDEGEHGEHHKRRRARHRRSRSSGSRRQSMDDARPHSLGEVFASGGVSAVGLSPRGVNRQGLLAADEHHRQHGSSGGGSGGEHHHHGHGSHGGQRGSSAGGHGHAHDSSSGGTKKKEKKDYASWAAATPEFRAVAAAAKHSSGGGVSGGSPSLLSTSPARSPGMMSPMRGQGGGFTPQAPGSPAPGHLHHLEHTAKGPDGTRGFTMGRGRPLTPAAP